MPVSLLSINVGVAPGDKSGDPARTAFQKVNTNSGLIAGGIEAAELKAFVVSCVGHKTNLAVEANVQGFRMPYGFELYQVRAYVDEAPIGADIILQLYENGTNTLLDSNGLVIPDGDEVSAGVAPPVTTVLEDWAKIHIDVDQVGSTDPGKGLDVVFIGWVILV